MQVDEAQQELRRVYLGGLVGQSVTGMLWLASSALSTWQSPKAGMLCLVLGGFGIYPATSLILRLLGRPAALGAGNPFRHLAIQVAFVLPLSMLLMVPVVLYRVDWFYPAMMVLVGAHYLPFATLYGMRSFLALAALLVASGVVVAVYLPSRFSVGGWFSGVVLLAFAGIGFAESRLVAFPAGRAAVAPQRLK